MKSNAGKADGSVQGAVWRLAEAAEPTTGEKFVEQATGY